MTDRHPQHRRLLEATMEKEGAMQSIKAWGLGQSFSTPTDMVLGSLCLLLFAILFRMAYLVVRPSCAVCNKRRWFWQMTSIVTSGSGPETCEVAYVCRHIPSCLK